MSNIVKYVAYGLGGTTLLAGSFFLAAAITGTPLSSMKGVGGLFPKEPKAQVSAAPGEPEIEVQLENDTRSKEQLFDAARSPLTAFVLEGPFSSQELASLERRLKDRLYELDQRERALNERETHLDEDTEHLQRQFQELERLKRSLLESGDEQRARDEELAAERKAVDALKVQAYRTAAAQFEGLEASEAATRLLSVYVTPDGRAGGLTEVAQVLRYMARDQATEILNAVFAVDPEKHRELYVLYVDAVSRDKSK